MSEDLWLYDINNMLIPHSLVSGDSASLSLILLIYKLCVFCHCVWLCASIFVYIYTCLYVNI